MNNIPSNLDQQALSTKASLNQKNIDEQIEAINPIILLKQPQLFKGTFQKLLQASQQYLKSKQWQKGLSALNKVLEMMDFGKNILKESISKYLKLTIFMNLAYGYQVQRKLQKCNRFCEKAKQEIQRLIQIAKNQQFSIQKYLKLSKFLVTLKFQHCAIISQLQQHEKALEMCKSTVPQIKEQIQAMLKYLNENLSSKFMQKKTGQTVQFLKHVKKFAFQLLSELIRFINQPLKKSHFYHWQKNPQQNQQQVKSKFIPSFIESKNQCKRSILGVNKSTHWIDEFNIGSIMHMNFIKVEDFETVLPMQEYFFKDRLYQIVILCSLSYFTMATQIRFIQPSKQKQKQKKEQINQTQHLQNTSQKINKQNQQKTISQNILKKYGYEQRSELFKLSQLYHLRAIQIVSKNIQSVIPYLSHIIKSYEKHYLKKKQLEAIIAIQQQSLLSVFNHTIQQYQPVNNLYNFDYLKKSSEIKNRQDYGNQISDLLIDSQDNKSIRLISKNSSELKDSFKKNIENVEIRQDNIKINNQNYQEAIQLNQIVNNDYLQSKKLINNIKENDDFKKYQKQIKKVKSKSKLKFNIIKNQKLTKSIKNNQHQSKKNVYTFRNNDNNKITKRHSSRSQSSKNEPNINGHPDSIIKIHSPQINTIRKQKSSIKNKLSSKSQQKLVKNIIGVHKIKRMQSEYDLKSKKNQNDKKNIHKKQKEKDEEKKNHQKYFTTYDGQKQFRIKHQSTTHIKVLFKKKQ